MRGMGRGHQGPRLSESALRQHLDDSALIYSHLSRAASACWRVNLPRYIRASARRNVEAHQIDHLHQPSDYPVTMLAFRAT